MDRYRLVVAWFLALSKHKHPMWKKKHTEATKAQIAASMIIARQRNNWSTKKKTTTTSI